MKFPNKHEVVVSVGLGLALALVPVPIWLLLGFAALFVTPFVFVLVAFGSGCLVGGECTGSPWLSGLLLILTTLSIWAGHSLIFTSWDFSLVDLDLALHLSKMSLLAVGSLAVVVAPGVALGRSLAKTI